jgi:hypothetical protein
MKKQFYVALLLGAIALFPALQLKAQEETSDQLWYCWEETVRPDKIDEYLELSKEVLELCKKENYPYSFFVWTRRSMVFENWAPIGSLDDIDRIGEEWAKILNIWGKEKTEAYNKTKMKHFSKTCTIFEDMAYMPESPEAGETRTYGRWIEMYLKPGKMEELASLLKKLNEQRASFGIREYVQFGSGGLGYQSPSLLVLYSQKSQEEFNSYFDSTPEAYKEKFQEFLTNMRKLLVQPPEIYHYTLLWDLSYIPEN